MSNHLKDERSPYLLQHADNPVDWWPWCDEAFQAAMAADKPIFLSIGYSTCHWCHVMAHESFEDGAIADQLNRDFIPIKVDREERPDVDAVYMAVCQTMTGSGGWPLTILMTPGQRPFFAATYLPPHTKYGQPGLDTVLGRAAHLWRTEREELLRAGDSLSAAIQPNLPAPGQPSRELAERCAAELSQRFDPDWGGFSPPPKFPTPHDLTFLFDYAALTGDAHAAHMAERTLSAMARGGICDQVGGGFSRYSTDKRWLIPHFEKMLYDNALLALAYLEGYHRTGAPHFRRTVERTLDFVLRELTHSAGGFFSGQDADSDGVEGKFYVFDPEELTALLGEADGKAFCDLFDITQSGNFEGRSVPNLLRHANWPDDRMDALCRSVTQYRLGRTDLHLDDKVLTAWNGLMIAALARAGALLEEPRYLDAARQAQRFLHTQLTDEKGRLFVRWREGHSAHAGQLDDYAFYALGLLELYRATFEPSYLSAAADTARVMLDHFSIGEGGGFYLTADDAEALISRPVEAYDGAMPSGNSAAGLALALLADYTGEQFWLEARDRQLAFLAAAAEGMPSAHCAALSALCRVVYPSAQLLCASADAALPHGALEVLRKVQAPNLTVLLLTPDTKEELTRLAPFTADYPIPDSGVTYYLCQNGACAAPFDDIQELPRLLAQ